MANNEILVRIENMIKTRSKRKLNNQDKELGKNNLTREAELLKLQKKKSGLTGENRKIAAQEIENKRAELGIEKLVRRENKKRMSEVTKANAARAKKVKREAADVEKAATAKEKMIHTGRRDLISTGLNPDNAKNAALIGKKNAKTNRMITHDMKEQKQLATKIQGETTRMAMNFLSVMFIGQAMTKFFKGMLTAGMNAFNELTKGTNNSNKALTMLQANIKFIQFSLGAAISDALLPFMDEIAKFAEIVSDVFMQNPKLTMLIIFGGIALGTILSITGQFTLLAASIMNMHTHIAGAGAVKKISDGVNGVDATKLSNLTKFMRVAGGLAVFGLSIGISIKALEGKSSFTDRLVGVLSPVVGGAIAGAMIGSIFPGVGTAIGAGIGAAVGFVVGVSITTVDYAKDTGMTSNDFVAAFKKNFTIGTGLKLLAAHIMGGTFFATTVAKLNVDTFISAGKVADDRGKNFFASDVGQQKLIETYDLVQKIKSQRAQEVGIADASQINLIEIRKQIEGELKNMEATQGISMFEILGLGGIFDNTLSKKDTEQLQAWLNRAQSLTLYQDRETQLAEAAQAGADTGESFAGAYTNTMGVIPTTINDISEEAIANLNENMETSNELIGAQAESLVIQAEKARDSARDINSLAKAQERLNRANKNKATSNRLFSSEDAGILDF